MTVAEKMSKVQELYLSLLVVTKPADKEEMLNFLVTLGKHLDYETYVKTVESIKLLYAIGYEIRRQNNE